MKKILAGLLLSACLVNHALAGFKAEYTKPQDFKG